MVPVSILDLAPIITGGTASDALRNTLDLARHAENWGYRRYWLAEHHNMPGIASSATSVVIGYVAAGTSRIRIGSGGIMLPNHAPLLIAEQFGTLESLYPGRIDLGIGRAPGSDRLAARAIRRGLNSDGANFHELLDELRAFLYGSGKLGVRAVPGDGLKIPMWLLGSSGFSAQLAGELGLPFAFASHFAPDYLLPALHLYRSSFHPSATLDKPYAMVGISVIAADTLEAALHLSTSQQQQALSLIRGRPGKLNPPVSSMDGLWTDEEKEMIRRRMAYSVIGDRDTVNERLQEILHSTGSDELIATSQIYDHQARLRSYELLAETAGLKRM